MVDYYCHVLPHLLCMHTSLECLDPATESMCFYYLSPDSFAPAYRFHIDASIKRCPVGHSLGQ